ncbi:50S ribosomal protein L35 [Rhodotorula diobovata]|uniref:50S ribosomal protein L35 n=1 Tax=Rhodotorula diobovata TaxID=5288 RepID=A0A5C5FQY8_9BASI|nr:50S ribosomal protein L35 [Rhodotorula diobovata]
MLAWQPLRTLARVASRPSLPSTWSLLSPPRLFSSSAPQLLVRKPTKYKLKTHQGAAKRWKALANGEFKRAKAGRVHLNSNGGMSRERLNRLGEPAFARPAWKRTLRRLLPYA